MMFHSRAGRTTILATGSALALMTAALGDRAHAEAGDLRRASHHGTPHGREMPRARRGGGRDRGGLRPSRRPPAPEIG